nr:hypothetical protein [Elizabethkingia sp. ASV34]
MFFVFSEYGQINTFRVAVLTIIFAAFEKSSKNRLQKRQWNIIRIIQMK